MTRMEEYQDLMQQIDMPIPELENTLNRAKRKKVRRDRIRRPIVGLTSAFVAFVMLVNFCTPVAYACSQIPFIKELAEAVTFSRSLSDAVDNEYIQPIYLEQTDGDVTAVVEYLIVDRKQVNVFYRLKSEVYSELEAWADISMVDGSWIGCSGGANDLGAPNDTLQSATFEFDEDIPGELRFQLDVLERGTTGIRTNDTDTFSYVARFEFMLEFDPTYMETGEIIPVNQTVVLDGQEITITDLEIYPTHLRINTKHADGNTAWLRKLYFYIVTDWGMRFDMVSNGVTATGDTASPAMVSFRADSTYFSNAKHLEVVITGAEWLDKDMERIYMNLETGEVSQLPQGVEFENATNEFGWKVELKVAQRKPNTMHQVVEFCCYDMHGKEYFLSSGCMEEILNAEGEVTHYINYIYLEDYPYSEVWFVPSYSHEWFAEEPISIVVQ